MITTPKYRLHSVYLGKAIFRRLPNTGTSGGGWLSDSVQYDTLASAKADIEYYAQQYSPEQIAQLQAEAIAFYTVNPR
jgi:hypothetical protein